MLKTLKLIILFVLVILLLPIFQSQASHSIVDGNETEDLQKSTQAQFSAYLVVDYPDGRQRKLKVPLEQKLLDFIEEDYKKGSSEDLFKTWPLEATIVNGNLGLRLEDKWVEAEKVYKLWLEYKWREENYRALLQHSRTVHQLVEDHWIRCDACFRQEVDVCTVSQPAKKLVQKFEQELTEADSAKKTAYRSFSDFKWSSVFDRFHYFGLISMNNLESNFQDLFKQCSPSLRSLLFDGPLSNYEKEMENINFQKKVRQIKIDEAKRQQKI